MKEIDLSKLTFTRATDAPTAESPVFRADRMYSANEVVFSSVAPDLVAGGWSVFPQERGEARTSAVIDGFGLKWKPYQDRLPSAEEIKSWAAQCPTHNVAIITGRASSHLFAIDADIEDEELCLGVRALAAEFLGATPFTRFGRPPRAVLLYRHEPEAKMAKRSFRFMKSAAEGGLVPSGDMLEVLANGSPFTAYGHHHKTGSYFHWKDAQPLTHSPDEAPLVTAEQMAAFIDAVQDLRPFYRKVSALTGEQAFEYDETSGLHVPKLLRNSDTEWLEDGEGLVVDGRESFLYTLVRRIVLSNVDAIRDSSGRGIAHIQGAVLEEFKRKAKLDGRWDEARLKGEIVEKVARMKRWVEENDIQGKTPERDASGNYIGGQEVQPPVRAEVVGTDSLGFLPVVGAKGGARKDVTLGLSAPATPEARVARTLSPDRTEIAAKVQDEIVEALTNFFDEVYSADSKGSRRIHVLKAPTGSGKTSNAIRYIAADPRTKQWDDAHDKGEDQPGPILFLLPTYNNIEELRLRAGVLNLDGTLNDDDLEEQARAKGIIAEDQFDVRIDDIRRDALSAGLRTMTYKGKLAAGCQLADKMKMIMEAGIGSSNLCKAIVANEEGEKEERYCPYYHGCPAIEQRKEIAKSHVVFLPHAFFTLKIPEELLTARCVVADERIFHLFVHTASLSRTTLKLARREPKLTRKERDAGMTPDVLIRDRDTAAEIAANALLRLACPAKALADYRETFGGKVVTGLELVRSAKRVCGNALTSGNDITPDMPFEDLKALCMTPTGTEVREEWRLWEIIEERIENLAHDTLQVGLVKAARANQDKLVKEADDAGLDHDPTLFADPKLKANGDRDFRIQFLLETLETGEMREKIRLSWRSTPNWAAQPLLLLDASAAPEIIGKIFNQREVVTHDIWAPLNVRTVAVIDKTYSNASIVAGAGRTGKEKLVAGRMKNALRCAISAVSGLYGWGRVVVGGSVVVRRAINTAWRQPTNLDWCHFGAMRGLDFAKNHAAAISIGRMEVPVQIIDGLVAALTYDDEVPELPYDAKGQNIGPDGETLKLPLEAQVIKMRSGQDVTVSVPTFPGRWARIVQKQYREEELSQFLGRLRPVYRTGEAPIWFAISKVIPDHVIVDEVITLDDLIMKPIERRFVRVKLWEGIRAAGGIVHDGLLEAASPHLFKTPQDARAEAVRNGFDLQTGKSGMDMRATWGFTPGRIRMPDGSMHWLFVRTDIRNPVDVIKEEFLLHLGIELGDVDIGLGDSVRPSVTSGIRPVDWVDQEIGAMDVRTRLEGVSITDASRWAIMNFPKEAFTDVRGNAKSSPVTIDTRDHPEMGGMSVTMPEIAAAQTTDLMWLKVQAGHVQRAAAKILPPGAEFDHLGDGAFDADAG